MTKIFDFTIIESHTTTSATIYDITTTVVDDIKCTTDRSTIEEDVDVDNNCDRENNQVHTIKHLNYDISMMIMHNQDDDSNYDYDMYALLYNVNTVHQVLHLPYNS